MLTKSDIDQIRKVVREEVENEVQASKGSLESDIRMLRMTSQNDMGDLKDRVKNVEIRMTKMHKELKQEIKMVLNFLDRDNMKMLKRVEKIEEHIGISSQ